jgi:hypothetical protein
MGYVIIFIFSYLAMCRRMVAVFINTKQHALLKPCGFLATKYLWAQIALWSSNEQR